MRAIVISQPGGPEVLELRDVPTPVPQRGEVRIRVRATAVNRADLIQRAGFYPAPKGSPADIPGLEYAGEIEALGEGVDEWKVGDRVFGLVGGGSYAEFLVTPARTVAPIPEGMPFVEAAAVPEAFLTAYDALVTQGRLVAGETVLIHAVGSGVGTAAAQVAKALSAKVIGTSRTEGKLDRALSLGVDEGVVTKDGKFAKAVHEFTAGRGADVIVELVGGAYVAEDVIAAATQGRIVLVGLVAGREASVNLGAVLSKRLSIIGTAMRSRPLEEKIQLASVLRTAIVHMLEERKAKPIVDRVLAFAEAGLAHQAMETNEGFGKIVLTVD